MSWKNVQYENGKMRTSSSGGGGGSSTLAGLDDVDTTGVSNGDILSYDDSTDKWIPTTPSGGGVFVALNTEQIADTNSHNLSDDITNYDLLIIQIYYTGSGYPFVGTGVINPQLLIASSHNKSIWIDGGNNDRAVQVQFNTNTTVQIISTNGNNGIHGVYGIKF